jgi:hypothetical protein
MLLNLKELHGHQLAATDGDIGHVEDFYFDDQSWILREIVVETGHWYADKAILIPPTKIERISYKESKVYVNLSKADIARTPEDRVAGAGAQHAGAETFPTE